jgi:hypothetical protein
LQCYFYRFLSAVLDEDITIRTFAEYCLVNVLAVCVCSNVSVVFYLLKVRNPRMFSHSFVECFYRLNEVKHPSWGDVTSDERTQMLFSLKGAWVFKIIKYFLHSRYCTQRITTSFICVYVEANE